jgi:hypothetical protein
VADNESILVTGAAGQLGAVGRTVTGLLLDRGFPVRAMVRREDDRAEALRSAGAEVVVGDLLEPRMVKILKRGRNRSASRTSVSSGGTISTYRLVPAVTRSPCAGRTVFANSGSSFFRKASNLARCSAVSRIGLPPLALINAVRSRSLSLSNLWISFSPACSSNFRNRALSQWNIRWCSFKPRHGNNIATCHRAARGKRLSQHSGPPLHRGR